ncbi:MAG: triphosphoribosyl-dephospho-CoA synthase, partial [Pseudomonadota bacterium]
SADAIERCVDKSMTLHCVRQAGLPTPTTITTEISKTAHAFLTDQTCQNGIVLKPIFGSQGNGLRHIKTPDQLPEPRDIGGVYHLQNYLPPNEHERFADFRILVSNGRALAAMKRTSTTWPTNVHQGGEPTSIDLTSTDNEHLARLAVAATQSVGARYAGVDVICDQDNTPQILEINSNPAWKGLQSVANLEIADHLVADFMTAQRDTQIETAFKTACDLELRALKPGNVHIFGDGHRMTVETFTKSAHAAAPYIADRALTVGQRIRAAVAATSAAVGCNTNLGICLLCAPLAHAARSNPASADALRSALTRTLASLSIEDAEEAYTAIRIASPAGLGTSQVQDVNQTPDTNLREAMALSAAYDRLGQAYADNFEDLFQVALPALQTALQRAASIETATTRLHMALLSLFPDSHIARKHGLSAAETVRAEAKSKLDAPHEDLLSFDSDLKARGLNPGTTADLVVATLFIHHLISR